MAPICLYTLYLYQPEPTCNKPWTVSQLILVRRHGLVHEIPHIELLNSWIVTVNTEEIRRELCSSNTKWGCKCWNQDVDPQRRYRTSNTWMFQSRERNPPMRCHNLGHLTRFDQWEEEMGLTGLSHCRDLNGLQNLSYDRGVTMCGERYIVIW